MKSRISLFLIYVFFALFLFYPLAYVFTKCFYFEGNFSAVFFQYMFTNPVLRECIINSFILGITVTLITTILTLPLAFVMGRFKFRFRGLLSSLMLVPMIMPPFVGAIGMRQMLARFGSINLLLMKTGILKQPVDWLGGGGFWGVVLMEVLHLYPLMFLNMSTALANIDPSMEEAAKNLGADGKHIFRTITFPLMLPGYFAGAILVFIWAFTDLGTPLIFEYTRLVPVQIFNMVTDIGENPMGYALVILVLLLTVTFFWISKAMLGRESYTMMAKGQVPRTEKELKGIGGILFYIFVFAVICISLLPHISVFLTSISGSWFMSILPSQITAKYYGMVFNHPLTVSSIRNSLSLSAVSMIFDILIGLMIAYLLARTKIKGKEILDAIVMLPLAIPGLILAFGYVASFSGGILDPRNNPFPLLIIAYTIRRIPFVVRTAYAGLQQTSVTFEEASQNLGATPFYTFRRISMPLISANIIAGGILAFSFAMLEVSDSLILAMKEQFYPITKAIYVLVGRIADGPYIASAMGVLGMILLAASLFLSNKFIGKRMGELFRI
ncbi:ABC transporter permease [Candidatus Desantisbacteria bacterium CG1_02_38_46]|uniref:ABC transporter permease n=3 Tax=unclassified Candidatus Desantisiibacteriota TaxID=3106372 RepID=A0A2H9PCX4_9BACT|nr:MAG: ABC transporter permease [Candidatus Desantisbacteria bacterium CG1_02_38_46]PIU52127.1 MAG: ABC transporter permease [Candidatus Desantisbacteria bacterium CG07_land_8_20_14_0_80_39_15]PIZ17222.1 MAG: ABC transporter permease [Candidatus Desantisbacteria bacterium CG_4_10_14_0_8_um_filter_39_17]